MSRSAGLVNPMDGGAGGGPWWRDCEVLDDTTPFCVLVDIGALLCEDVFGVLFVVEEDCVEASVFGRLFPDVEDF